MNTSVCKEDREIMVRGLLAEHRMLSDEMLLHLRELTRVPVLTAAIIGFIFGIGGAKGFSEFSRLLGIPVLAGLVFYATYLYYGVIKVGRYRAVVEEDLNALVGRTVMRWNSKVTRELEWIEGPKDLVMIFQPIYVLGVFGGLAVIAIVLLLSSGRLTPSQVWGPSAVYWMAALLVLALFSLFYVVVFGRRRIEKKMSSMRGK